MDYMAYLYQHPELLMYFRYHPKWYKILYYEPSYFDAFIKEAKANLGIRAYDRLEGFKKNYNMFYNLAGLLNKKK
jgi:hypothetical protein